MKTVTVEGVVWWLEEGQTTHSCRAWVILGLMNFVRSTALTFAGIAIFSALAQEPTQAKYDKREVMIPMRDGIKLFTTIYTPKRADKPFPIMMIRTPYSCAPYGPNVYRQDIGPSKLFVDAGYAVVYQDVRGRYMSEGDFLDMRPQLERYTGNTSIDESTDTYDSIDWIAKNVANNNGRVGIWGISYPGFYAAAATINTHPALKAVSPQAPIADWFIGDDFHHNGALFLQDGFNFMNGFGRPRPKPTTNYPPGIRHGMDDAYKFFLQLGPLSNANSKYFVGQVAFWNEMMAHPNYDEFWQARNLLPHLKNIKCAVLTVGGFFDAEDLYGPLHVYSAIERNNPGIHNSIVMGPWFHGGWARSDGSSFGDISFESQTSVWYQNEVEFPFFDRYLRGDGTGVEPEARIFCTGSNVWKTFAEYPPKSLRPAALYLSGNQTISQTVPTAKGFDEYLSDPNKPVPYRPDVSIGRNREYMIWDQRFAATRPDVLVYRSQPLPADITLAGPMVADLYISTTGTDSDFVVKLIDEFPDNAIGIAKNLMPLPFSGYQMLVRGEVMRAKFRDSFSKPVALVPNQITRVKFNIQDACHTFLRGHRIMIQIQSSWFPLVDRNPQTFVDIPKAKPSDFRKATIRVHFGRETPSALRVGILPN